MLSNMKHLLILLAIPALANCPISIKCNYHNVFSVPKTDTEWRGGKQYGIYEHDYIDERGKQRKCKLILECK